MFIYGFLHQFFGGFSGDQTQIIIFLHEAQIIINVHKSHQISLYKTILTSKKYTNSARKKGKKYTK